MGERRGGLAVRLGRRAAGKRGRSWRCLPPGGCSTRPSSRAGPGCGWRRPPTPARSRRRSSPSWASRLPGSTRSRGCPSRPWSPRGSWRSRRSRRPPAGLPASGAWRTGWAPTVDGAVLPQHPFDPEAPALSAGVPMPIGTTLNEFVTGVNNPGADGLTDEELARRVGETHGPPSSFHPKDHTLRAETSWATGAYWNEFVSPWIRNATTSTLDKRASRKRRIRMLRVLSSSPRRPASAARGSPSGRLGGFRELGLASGGNVRQAGRARRTRGRLPPRTCREASPARPDLTH